MVHPKSRPTDISRSLAENLTSRYVNTWTVFDSLNNDRWTSVVTTSWVEGSANLPNIYSQDAARADTMRGSLL